MTTNIGPRVWKKRTYNKLSKYYDFLMKYLYPIGEKGRKKIVERLNDGSILDVACGTGTLLAMAYEKGLRCYGTDLSEGMINQARIKVPKADFTIASYYMLPYSSDYFDYVVATNALSAEFIDAKKILLEMIRVCRVGGEIYIAEWPKSLNETLMERIIVKLASLNDDAPKDYQKIFRELNYEPEVEVLSKRYHVLSITKS